MPPGQLYTTVGKPTDIASSVTSEKLSDFEVSTKRDAFAISPTMLEELPFRNTFCASPNRFICDSNIVDCLPSPHICNVQSACF